MGEPDGERRVLTLIRAHHGRVWHADAEGGYWRAYRFIPSASTFDAVESPDRRFRRAGLLGASRRCSPACPRRACTRPFPTFTTRRNDSRHSNRPSPRTAAGRAILAKPEIEFALARESITGVLLDAGLPERVTHNDTKFNNVLLDDATGEGICVIDLDTVMPGLAPYDFGDMVRTATSPAQEDERDLSKISMQFPMFEALARGYLSQTGGLLTQREKELLAFSAKLITFEIGIRFLTDYLAGDTYFKVHREGHNLDRCRAQFKLVESIEQQEEQMTRLVESLSS